MFQLDLTDEQLKLMLETLAEKHIILFMQNKCNAEMANLIQEFHDGLKNIEKEYIFFTVFKDIELKDLKDIMQRNKYENEQKKNSENLSKMVNSAIKNQQDTLMIRNIMNT